MIHVLIKVYGAFFPTDALCLTAVEEAGQGAMGQMEEPWFVLEGDMLLVSFEGIFFPSDDVLAAFAKYLPARAEGKLDVLDLESWTLHRHVWVQGNFQSFPPRDLNQVMDYAGL